MSGNPFGRPLIVPNAAYLGGGPARRKFMGDGSQVNPGYLPAGSQLVYNVTWASSLTNFSNPSDIAAAVNANVSANSGIQVSGSQVASTFWSTAGVTQATGLSFTITLMQDYTSAAMVQSVMDSAVAGAGRPVASSNIKVVSIPSAPVNPATMSTAPPSGAPQAGPSSVPGAAVISTTPSTGDPVTDFFVNNWQILALAGLGAMLLL